MDTLNTETTVVTLNHVDGEQFSSGSTLARDAAGAVAGAWSWVQNGAAGVRVTVVAGSDVAELEANTLSLATLAARRWVSARLG